MAWKDLKAAVAAVIKTNDNQEITGALLQSTLNSIIDQVGANASYKGVAIPSTNPGVPDGIVFYLAQTDGTYSNFGGLVLSQEICFIKWNGSAWVKETIGALKSSDYNKNIVVTEKLNFNRITKTLEYGDIYASTKAAPYYYRILEGSTVMGSYSEGALYIIHIDGLSQTVSSTPVVSITIISSYIRKENHFILGYIAFGQLHRVVPVRNAIDWSPLNNMVAFGEFEYDMTTDTFTYPNIALLIPQSPVYKALIPAGSKTLDSSNTTSLRILKAKLTKDQTISELEVVVFTDFTPDENEFVLAAAYPIGAPVELRGKINPMIPDHTFEKVKALQEYSENIQEELTLLNAYIKSNVGEEYTVGTTATSITGLFPQRYTDYFWVLNTEIPNGELKKITVLSDGNPGMYNFYLLAPGEDFTVKVKIPVTLPDNAGVPSVISLIAGTDFDAGIMVQEGWKLARLKRTGEGFYYTDNTKQPTNSGYLKVISTEPEVNSIISGGSYFAWKPEFSCTILAKSINKRLEYLESNFVDVSSLQTQVNGHESRIHILETEGVPADSHNVAAYGAVGDGVTDDKLAIQAAINANYGSYVKFNDGDYYISGSINILQTIELKGNFRSTILRTYGNFPILNVIGGVFALEGFNFFGSGKADAATKPNQFGIYVNSIYGDGIVDPFKVNIREAEFYNFAGTGLALRMLGMDSVGFFKGSAIHNVNAYDCNIGIHLDRRAEYTTLSVFNTHGCNIGLRISGGNMVVGDGSIVQCVKGLQIDDGGVNSAHGTLCNVGIKHCSQYSVYAENTQIGFVLGNLNIFDGNIYLKNIKGFQFSNCQLAVPNYYFEGAVKCRFVNNLLYDSVYTLHHNYNGVVSDVAFDETLKMN